MTDDSRNRPPSGASSDASAHRAASDTPDDRPAPGEVPATAEHPRPHHRWVFLRELAIVVVIALALSFLVKTFLVQPFSIPSPSMENTLITGDRILVSKFTPQHSALHRGDVVVFSKPNTWGPDESNPGPVKRIVKDALIGVGVLPGGPDHLVKRVIGLPGDHVVCCNSKDQITVNGYAITEKYLPPGEKSDDGPDARFDITVPAGKVWVLGDNRADSADSRVHNLDGKGVDGTVPISDITGQVVAIAWPISRIGGLPTYGSVFADVPKPRP
ncbi:signal peptidase I [Allobranchiibius sp. GilTou73]|uniref:signal peptidase I n=1 Tax=Allobranchiibius sp. GilTou73 TaxID=2904523 RepID=UPI001F36C000|nr:signal peptidase I [Allobranchiibius sp. GilTou73]UIJ34470.1 signal peptidase I [Allobranchiibius sp. GilTou73]